MMFASQIGHLVIVAGQSNAVGWDMNASMLPVNLQTTVRTKIWTTNNGFENLVNGSNNDQASGYAFQRWGMEAEYARRWVGARGTQRLFIAKYAIGSTTLAVEWASGGAQRTAFASIVSDAKAAITALGLTPKVHDLLWMQGESDALDETQANAYQTNLSEWFTYVRSTLGDANTRIAVGRVQDSASWPYRSTVRAAQAAIVAADSGKSCLIDTDSYLTVNGDGYHFDADGNVALGADMYAGLHGS